MTTAQRPASARLTPTLGAPGFEVPAEVVAKLSVETPAQVLSRFLDEAHRVSGHVSGDDDTHRPGRQGSEEHEVLLEEGSQLALGVLRQQADQNPPPIRMDADRHLVTSHSTRPGK